MSVTACAALVAEGDPDRFAATMAAPAGLRPRLWPLYAANLEIARAPWAAHDPLLAAIRLQWWIDRLDDLAAGVAPPPGHPVLAALSPLEQSCPGTAALIAGLAVARRRDARRDPPADAGALWDYLDATSGHLIWAAARALGAAPLAEAVVRDFAAGAGLASWLNAWPELARRGMALPAQDADLAGLAGEGLVRLAKARRAGLPGGLAPALWPGWQARAILARAAGDPALIRAGGLAASEFRRRGGLLWCALTGRW